MLIYSDQLLTVRKIARHHHIVCPPGNSYGFARYRRHDRKSTRERERERKQTKRVERGNMREEIQEKRTMGKAFLAWPAALMRTFCHLLDARSCVIKYVHTKHILPTNILINTSFFLLSDKTNNILIKRPLFMFLYI